MKRISRYMLKFLSLDVACLTLDVCLLCKVDAGHQCAKPLDSAHVEDNSALPRLNLDSIHLLASCTLNRNAEPLCISVVLRRQCCEYTASTCLVRMQCLQYPWIPVKH